MSGKRTNQVSLWIIIMAVVAGCDQHTFQYQEDEGVSLSIHQMQFIDNQIGEAANSNRTGDVSGWIREVARRQGPNFFRCRANSNFWVCVNSDSRYWRSWNTNEEHAIGDNEVIMYAPMRFISETERRSFYVGLLSSGNQTNLTERPAWQPVQFKREP